MKFDESSSESDVNASPTNGNKKSANLNLSPPHSPLSPHYHKFHSTQVLVVSRPLIALVFKSVDASGVVTKTPLRHSSPTTSNKDPFQFRLLCRGIQIRDLFSFSFRSYTGIQELNNRDPCVKQPSSLQDQQYEFGVDDEEDEEVDQLQHSSKPLTTSRTLPRIGPPLASYMKLAMMGVKLNNDMQSLKTDSQTQTT